MSRDHGFEQPGSNDDYGDDREYEYVIEESLLSSMEVVDEADSYCCFNIKTCVTMLLLFSLASLGAQYYLTGEHLEVKALFTFLDLDGLYSEDYMRIGIAVWQFSSIALLLGSLIVSKRFLLLPYILLQATLVICETAVFSTCLIFSALDKIDYRLTNRLSLILDIFCPKAFDILAVNEPVVLGMTVSVIWLSLTMINFIIISILERLFRHLKYQEDPWNDCGHQ